MSNGARNEKHNSGDLPDDLAKPRDSYFGIGTLAARRAGASGQELHKVVELASATGALAPANQGAALLQALRDRDDR